MWPEQVEGFLKKLNIALPVIQAPMAGGATTPELVAAVANAGGLGSIGGALLSPDALWQAIQATRKLTQKPFSVNLFAPQSPTQDHEKIKHICMAMQVYYEELGMMMGEPVINPASDVEEQIAVLLQEQVKIISFTFGTLRREVIQQLKQNGVTVIGTATTVREAMQLQDEGYDAIVAQGSEAGGHRGTFMGDFASALIGTMALVPQIVDHVNLPVIAAGGIMDGRGLAAAMMLGACAVQMGTAFLTCPEAGIHRLHKEAILKSNEESSVITSVFSGRPARGIRNRFVDEMEEYQNDIPDYPIQQSLTQPIRKKAAELNKSEYMSLWAGQGTRLSQTKSAAELLESVIKQAQDLL